MLVEVHLEDLMDHQCVCSPDVVCLAEAGVSCAHHLSESGKAPQLLTRLQAFFSPSWHNILSPSSSSSSSSTRSSDGRLQLGQVPLVHAVVAHQLVRAGKLLLTVGPAACKGLLT